MPVNVVDASALAAMAFNETPGAGIRRRLEGHKLIAPTLLPYELTSVCLKKCMTRPAIRQALIEALERVLLLPVELLRPDHSAVFQLAEKHKLSGYDASYLWLSLTSNATLVTLDIKLLKVARQLAVI